MISISKGISIPETGLGRILSWPTLLFFLFFFFFLPAQPFGLAQEQPTSPDLFF
jgi:hypothetical protein